MDRSRRVSRNIKAKDFKEKKESKSNGKSRYRRQEEDLSEYTTVPSGTRNLFDYIVASLSSVDKEKLEKTPGLEETVEKMKERLNKSETPLSEIKKLNKKANEERKRSYANVVKGFVPERITVAPPDMRNILLEEQNLKNGSIDRRKEVDMFRDNSKRYVGKQDKSYVKVNIPVSSRLNRRQEQNIISIPSEEESQDAVIDILVEVLNAFNVSRIRVTREHFEKHHLRIRSRTNNLVVVHYEKGGKRSAEMFSHLPEIPMFPEIHGTIIDVEAKWLINRSLPLPHDVVLNIAYTNEGGSAAVKWGEYWEHYSNNLDKENYTVLNTASGSVSIPLSKARSQFFYPIPEEFDLRRQELKVKYKDHEGKEVADSIDMSNDGYLMNDQGISINIGTEGIVLVIGKIDGKVFYATHKKFNPPELMDMFNYYREQIEYNEGRPLFREDCDYSPFVYTYMIPDDRFVTNSFFQFPVTQLATQTIWEPSVDGTTYGNCPYDYDGPVESYFSNPHNTKSYKGGEVIVQPSYVPCNELWCTLFYGKMTNGLLSTLDAGLIRSIAEENFMDGHFIVVTKRDIRGRIIDCYKLMSKSYEIKHRLTGGNNNLYNVFNNMLGNLNRPGFIFNSLFEDRIICSYNSIEELVNPKLTKEENYRNLVESDKIENICYFMRDEDGISRVRQTTEYYGMLNNGLLNIKSGDVTAVLEWGVANDMPKASYWLLRYKIACIFCNFMMCYNRMKYMETLNILERFYKDLDSLTNYIADIKSGKESLDSIYIQKRRGFLTPQKVYEVKKKVRGISGEVTSTRKIKKNIKNHILRNNLGERFHKIVHVLHELELLK